MVFTNKLLLCNWESYLVSQLYWLKGPCNRFQTHKRFKRFEVYKSDVLVLLFWKQNMTLSQSDRFPPWGGKQSDWPIRLLSLPGGKTIWLVLCCHMISQKWNSQFSLVPHYWVNTQVWVNPHRWGKSFQNDINIGSKVWNILVFHETPKC